MKCTLVPPMSLSLVEKKNKTKIHSFWHRNRQTEILQKSSYFQHQSYHYYITDFQKSSYVKLS